MTIQQIQTANFTIQYDDTYPNRSRRAYALAKTCEKDHSTLASWFGTMGGFGSTNHVSVVIGGGGLTDGQGAKSNGYHDDGSMWINVDPQDSNTDDTTANDIVRLLFVAEFAETLMDLRGRQYPPASWNRKDSNGEGLSRMCALLLYPSTYHSYRAPEINTWLTAPKRDQDELDFISKPYPGDDDKMSYGCALLFLFFLKDQLKFSVPDIIATNVTSLEAIYYSLTGQTGGRKAFNQLLNTFFPVGQTPPLTSYNPFPLFQNNHDRQINLTYVSSLNGPDEVVATGSIKTQPFHTCPVKNYTYTIHRTPQMLLCTATTKGFGVPIFTWTINGLTAPFSGTIDMVSVFKDDPALPAGGTYTTQPVRIECSTTSKPGDTNSGLLLTFPDNTLLGHFDITVQVSAQEKFASTTVKTATSLVTVDNEQLVWEDQFYKDKVACEVAYEDRLHRYIKLVPNFRLTLPDPPPEYVNVIRRIQAVATELQQVSKQDPAMASEMMNVAAHNFGMSLKSFQTFSQEGN